MRRFLDWTAAQTANSNQITSSNNNRQTHNINMQPQQTITTTPQQQHLSHAPMTGTMKDLELQHLLKLLHDIKYYQSSSSPLPSSINSQSQREFVDKIHKTLPLFLNVFGCHSNQGLPTGLSTSFALIDTAYSGSSGIGSHTYGAGRSTSQSSLSIDEARELSQCESCPSSKPTSPLPPRSPPMDKYPDLIPFSFTIARLFVSEVRRRASDKHAEDASLAILQFLNFKHLMQGQIQPVSSSDKSTTNTARTNQQPSLDTDDDVGQGWNLLLSLNTLASSQNPQIIQLLCDASLPSTLIKCLYLFYDLPVTLECKKIVTENQSGPNQDATQNPVSQTYRTQDLVSPHLVQAFTQLLVQICSYQSAIDELIRRDDLRLVLGIASNRSTTQNKTWRRTAFQTLIAISKNMRDNFIYLEQNLCIQVYVDNLNRTNSLGLTGVEDIIEMIKVLVEFVYNIDVNNRNQPRSISPMIEQFKTSRIMELIEELLIKIDDSILQDLDQNHPANDSDPTTCSTSQQPSVSSEVGVCVDDYRRYGKRLVQTFITMAKIYFSQEVMTKNLSLKPLATNRFEMLDQFKMIKPSARDCILNNEVLRVFKVVWSKCRDYYIIEAILDATISLFNGDKYNYFIFESEQLLVYYMSSPNFSQFPCRLRQKIFKFLEFIVIETNYIPCLELGTLGALLTAKNSSDFDRSLILRTLIACLRFNTKFSDIFRDIGILEVIINLLNETMQRDLSQKSDNFELLYLLLETSQHLLAGSNNLNCTQFNESGAARHVFNCLSKPKFFHLFIPPRSSSSEDGCSNSRNSTPTPTALSRNTLTNHQIPIIQASHNLTDLTSNTSRNKTPIKQMQKVAFTIIRQLILSSAGDEHLANLLGLLARTEDDLKALENQDEVDAYRLDMNLLISQEVNLKIYILKSLMIILKDNHRCRTLFRKVGGFVYIVSSLNSLEKALPLCEPCGQHLKERHDRWKLVNSRRIWRLIKNALMTIVVALRSEPANLRVFCDEILPQFTDTIMRLGCFRSQPETFLKTFRTPLKTENFNLYKSIFLAPSARDLTTVNNDNVLPVEACCQLLRFLYDMSLDMADGTHELDEQLNEESGKVFRNDQSHQTHDTKSLSFDHSSPGLESGLLKRRPHLQKSANRPPSLDLKNCSQTPAILTFPSLVLSMIDLIPVCPDEELMLFASMVIKTLFKSERNQQLLCEAGMISRLLNGHWQITLTTRGHFLHNLSEFMFERLTRQAITPREMKMFFRLGDPLCCKCLDDIEVDSQDQIVGENDSLDVLKEKSKEKLLTCRIETFVNMMTIERSKQQPPFIEFDMNGNGSSFIFMPSIAPVNARSLPQNLSYFLNSTLDVHTNEKNGVLGGVGSSERLFPPSGGLTFSTWICVERFPTRSPDTSHNIRLLTIYRGSAATGKEYACLRIQISALDRALTVSTQENLLFDNDSRPDNHSDPDCFVRVWTPETLFEGRWHHIVITLGRTNQKQSAIHIYIDGQLIHNQRINYISHNIGPLNSGPLGSSGSNLSSAPAAFVNAFIGSLPQIRLQTRTRWKQGPCHLIEETLSSNFVTLVHSLGPDYIGNFQSVNNLGDMSRMKTTKYANSMRGDAIQSHTHVLHHSASVAHSSPRHAFPLTRVSSSAMNAQAMQKGNLGYNHAGHCSQINEDKILISIDARSTSFMSLTRMRRIYTRFDCRQVSRFLGLSAQESSTPLLLMHNTSIHLNGSSRGIGALALGYNNVRCFIPSPAEHTLFYIGGSYVLIGLVAQSQTSTALYTGMRALVHASISNPKLQAQLEGINGFQIITVMLWKKKHLLNQSILTLVFALVMGDQKMCNGLETRSKSRLIKQVAALRELVCECFDLWLQINMINSVLEFIHDLINSVGSEFTTSEPIASSVRNKNLKYLREMDLLPRMLRLLPRDPIALANVDLQGVEDPRKEFNESESGSEFDAKAIYLIKQTVFELLNRTPRQSDILYFGQFLTSLLPSDQTERSEQTINLRNVLLKSLLQMMTRNKQPEINQAMQEEIVKMVGFDWFMLFISGPHLNNETVTLGFLNLMIILSNDELYQCFKTNSTSNGGWLKEPTFPTIDGKFNIQLLGINVGVFFGLNGKGKAICQDVLEAPNFCLLISCLVGLKDIPHIYLMLFQTMMGCFSKLDAAILDSVSSFNKLNLDSLCDCLIGDTHHKRRQTLVGIQFRCLELVVTLIYMIRDIMSRYEDQTDEDAKEKSDVIDLSNQQSENIPTDILRFFMYLYNNNPEFQHYCRRSDDLIDSLSDALMTGDDRTRSRKLSDGTHDEPTTRLTKHPAVKEVLELSRLIILDRMTEINTEDSVEISSLDQLQTFGRFLDSLSACREAQVELIDMLLRQVLLVIDSTSRHNSIKTINSTENIQQFRLLLINSILISQIIVDKIWLEDTFADNTLQLSNMIDHQLSLAEQIFKFNEILPKNSPPYAFVMQHTLNRILLYALSRPLQHVSDKMFMLDLLKKIYDNRTIIILNHMHSPHSAEFFVSMTYCLMKLIDENSTTPVKRLTGHQSISSDQPASYSERQYGNQLGSSYQRGLSVNDAPNSSALMLVSVARKVWDAVYQSKRGILSEAFDVPLSLPAFTLDTSLDLLQLKPDISATCEKYWSSLIEFEQKPKKRLQPRPCDTNQGTTSAAVNILSGRLTRVVNAASFVSRVVGATAGSMASNVNLVGERLVQTGKAVTKPQRSPSDLSANALSHRSSVSETTSPGSTSAGPASINQHQSQTNLSNQLDCFRQQKLSSVQISNALKSHISIIDNYIKSQLAQKGHKLALHKYLCDEWMDLESEMLLRERALFGPDYESQLEKWCLDLTEGPRRMRKKMVNNTKQFYDNYAYKPEQYNPDNKSLRYRPPMSFDSHLYYLKSLGVDRQLFMDALNVDAKESEQPNPEDTYIKSPTSAIAETNDTVDDGRTTPIGPIVAVSTSDSPAKRKLYEFPSSSLESISSALKFTPSGSPMINDDNDQEDGDSTSFVDFSPEIEAETNSARESENVDSLSVLRLLEKNERISHMFRCSRVQGLDTYEGLLLFGREHFYLIDGFTLLKTREIKDIDSLPPDAHDPIIPNSTPNIMAHSKKTCAKFSYDSVMEVHKRRYLLQPIALEIFSSDGRNTLIVFPRNIRNKVHSRLMTMATQITNNAQDSLAGQKSNVSVEGGTGLLSNLIGETSVTQRWVRGELSNFQYLMNLNTIAGRSYNDLMQYPIFPWVLADYTSDYLDLNKPSTFRDLSRPIGAQTSERLDQFKRRFSEWDDSETPPYHYGTFYSSAMIVASYMVRMEPFTQHFLRLQGGHFDLADRMFHSINDSWLSASKHNMADIRELIPEFFYLPEFLMNDNKYDLGIKQNGMRLDDVKLPPWAKDDARELIRLHRCALESDYVSAHLHEWIDLIFGYKQQGQPAIDAVNVFHHLFYEGNVDIYNTEIDPIKKNAVIGFINNFGQVPKQLFKRSHPARKVSLSMSGSSPMPLTPILPSLTAPNASSVANQRIHTHCPHKLRQASTTFKDLRGPVGQIIQVDKNIVAVEQNKLLIPPEYCRYIAWGHADRSLRLGLYESEKPIFVWEGSETLSPYEIHCCAIPNNRMMITAGTESLITVWKIEKMRSFVPISNLYGHTEPVTCLAASQAYSLIVSGSRDRTAIIWDLNRLTFVRQLGSHRSQDKLVHRGPISAIAINDSTGDIATCATSWLYLWSINGQLLAQVDTFTVVLQQSMLDPSGTAGMSISSNLSQLHILSVCFSQYNEWDLDEVIITGSSDGSVAFWSMRYYQSPMTEAEIEQAARKKANSFVDVSADGQQHLDDKEPNLTTGTESTVTEADVLSQNEPVESAQEATETGALKASEPIAITQRGPRQRTDTMNSEWVKLSSSSASANETIPMLQDTPTSPNEFLSSSDFVASGESFGNDNMIPTIKHEPLSPGADEAYPESGNNCGLVDNNTESALSRDLSSACTVLEANSLSTKVVTTIGGGSSISLHVDNSASACATNLDDVTSEQLNVTGTGGASRLNSTLTPADGSIKFSKSDTSLVDSFVMLGESSPNHKQSGQNPTLSRQKAMQSKEKARSQSSADNHDQIPSGRSSTGRRLEPIHSNASRARLSLKLQPNHCWRRELYLRGVLPKRRSKTTAPAITCLSISKDHKNLYVGDAFGKISSWTTN